MNDTPSSITAPSHDPSLFLPSSSVCVAMMLILCLRFDDVASLFNLAVYCIDIEVLSTLSSCSSPKPRIEKDDNAASLPFFFLLLPCTVPSTVVESSTCCVSMYALLLLNVRSEHDSLTFNGLSFFLSFFYEPKRMKEREEKNENGEYLSLSTHS